SSGAGQFDRRLRWKKRVGAARCACRADSLAVLVSDQRDAQWRARQRTVPARCASARALSATSGVIPTTCSLSLEIEAHRRRGQRRPDPSLGIKKPRDITGGCSMELKQAEMAAPEQASSAIRQLPRE
ncbi:hypothetical protein ACU4GD_35420, partial [Cupriavidus basilensis]